MIHVSVKCSGLSFDNERSTVNARVLLRVKLSGPTSFLKKEGSVRL